MHTPCAHPAPWLATVTVAVAVLGAVVTTFAGSAPASATTQADGTTAQANAHAAPRT
jgi:hypothetical protein